MARFSRKSQILWKSLWESTRKACEIFVNKFVEKANFECSGCSVLWESVRFCEELFGFVEVCSGKCGKVLRGVFGKDFAFYTISTYPTTITTKLFRERYLIKGRR